MSFMLADPYNKIILNSAPLSCFQQSHFWYFGSQFQKIEKQNNLKLFRDMQ
jgi:hypothetical protein